MNDRFKFRVWNTISKKLRNVAQITLDSRQHGCFSEIEDMETCKLPNQPHLILEQCTGLKDNNGKLIYEGDIVDLLPEVDETAVVEWDEVTVCFCVVSKSGGFMATFDNYRGDDLEVIGNIHENPELLEVQK